MIGFLSIDLAKDTLDAKLRVGFDGKEIDFLKMPHSQDSWKKLQKQAKAMGITQLRVCMEATNNFWKQIAEFFHSAGATVHVINPARIKAQRKTEQTRSKSDKIDIGLIMRFLLANYRELHIWSPLPRAVTDLQELVRMRDFFVDQRTELKVRLKSGASVTAVVTSSQAVLHSLTKEIDSLESRIEEVIKNDAILNEQFVDADRVTGVGLVTASVLISECRAFAEIREIKQVVAFSGLDPMENSSGTLMKPRKISKQGSALLRKTFVCAAASAVKADSVFREFYKRLLAKGLSKKSALVATARKLLEVTTAVVLSHTTFDPTRNRLAS